MRLATLLRSALCAFLVFAVFGTLSASAPQSFEVQGIKVFESGTKPDKESKRFYGPYFPYAETDGVWLEATVKNSLFEVQDQTVRMRVEYFRNAQNLASKVEEEIEIKSKEETALLSVGIGGKDPGEVLGAGLWSAKVYLNENEVGEVEFYIFKQGEEYFVREHSLFSCKNCPGTRQDFTRVFATESTYQIGSYLHIFNLSYGIASPSVKFHLQYENKENGKRWEDELSLTLDQGTTEFKQFKAWGDANKTGSWAPGDYSLTLTGNGVLVHVLKFRVTKGKTPYQGAQLKFYEGPEEGVAEASRKQSSYFGAPDARYIYADLSLPNPSADLADEVLRARFVWKKDGKEVGSKEETLTLAKEMHSLRTSVGYGKSAPGSWEPGDYSVDLLINDQLVVSTPFRLFTDPSQTVRPLSIRLYEGSDKDLYAENPAYSDFFDGEIPRYIYARVRVENLLQGLQKQDVEMQVKFFRGGKELGEHTRTEVIPKDSAAFDITLAYGNMERNFWFPGEYVAKCVYGGKEVMELEFEVSKNPPLVIDYTDEYVIAGFAGDEAPTAWVPPYVFTSPDGKFFGEEALKQGGADAKRVISKGIVTDWTAFKELLEFVLKSKLQVEVSEYRVLMHTNLGAPEKERTDLTDLMFGTYKVRGFFVTDPHASVAKAYGLSTGMSVGFFYDRTESVPVEEGRTKGSHLLSLDIGKKDLIDYLMRELAGKGFKDTPENREVATEILNTKCYFSADYSAELRKSETGSEPASMFILPGGSTLKLGKEMFMVPEPLFKPILLEKSGTGVQQDLYQSVMNCPEVLRSRLWPAVMISGGAGEIPGLAARLQNEVSGLAPGGSGVNVKSLPRSRFTVWTGGSTMATADDMSGRWVTPKEYALEGSKVVIRKCP